MGNQEAINNYKIASAYVKKAKFQEAIVYFKLSLTQDPRNIYCIIDYAGVLSTVGEYNKAINILEKLLDSLPLDDIANKTGIFNNLGNLWLIKGYHDKALNFYEKALEHKSFFFLNNDWRISNTYNNIALAWMDKGNYPKAMEYHQKALDIRITLLTIFNPVQRIQRMNNDHLDEAKPDNTKEIILARISDRKKKIAQDFYSLAKIAKKESKHSDSEIYSKLAVEHDPDNNKYLSLYNIILANQISREMQEEP